MDIRFLPTDLRRFDEVRAEVLALPLFFGQRPLRGALGLVDWRMIGQLSSAVKEGRIDGSMGEHLLVSSRPRLPFDKLLVYGAGERAGFDEGAFSEAVRGLLGALGRARIRSSVCLLPGRESEEIGAERAMELFLEAFAVNPIHDEFILLEDADAERVMVPVLERAKRRARARDLD